MTETPNTGMLSTPTLTIEKVIDTSAEKACWDLSDLYQSPVDPKLKEDEAWATREAERFAQDFRGRVKDAAEPTAEEFAEMLRRYEELFERTYKVFSYARLLHSADTSRAEYGALLSRAYEFVTSVQTTVIFFELDWIALDDSKAEPIWRSPRCRRWRHFLRSIRRYRAHTLSEPEEIILTEKHTTGVSAFRRLFDEVTSSVKYEIELNGEKSQLSQSEVLALLYSPDRRLRIAGHQSLTHGLEKNTHLATFIFNTIVKDHEVNNRLKMFPDPAASRHLSNEIERESVDALLAACEQRSDIVQDYYRLKARLLGLETLYDYDRYAPVEIEAATLPTCEWNDACRIVNGAYADFDDSFGQIASEFLDKGWIDAATRAGKQGGAFCSATVPSVHPYILMNYTGQLHDVMTLAHELGHGVHQYLSRGQGILQCSTSLTLAETASVFGEMLVFNRLKREQSDPRVRLALLCHRLEDSFSTIFRQVALTRFEQSVHAARAQGELSTDQLDQMWLEANAPMHGDVVKLTDGYRRWWSYIGHFIHSPFYCYAYSFGELLVLALWSQYGREGKAFVPRYLELLKAGGSDTPANLISRFELNIDDTRFWNSGLSVLEKLLHEAKQLAQKVI